MKTGIHLVRRIVVTVVGVAILVVGAVFLLAPGPGFLVVALGFLVLSMEYAWARRIFERARGKALDLAEQAVASRTSTVLTVLFALGMIGLGVALGVVPSLPLSGWAAGGSVIVSGLIILGTVVFSIVHVRRRERSASSEGDDPATARGKAAAAGVSGQRRQRPLS